MSLTPQQRQKSLEKKATKRKQKAAIAKRQSSVVLAQSRSQFEAAASWPLLEALITRGWDEPGVIVEAIVAREASNGRVAVASFLIDLGCLGIKDAIWKIFPTVSEYERTLRLTMVNISDLIKTDINLVSKVIREANAYAATLGFHPHADYFIAAHLLIGADPDVSPVSIPVGGPDGRPFYVEGPYDNVESIIARLTEHVGPDGFDYVFPAVGLDLEDLDLDIEALALDGEPAD